MAKITGIGGVFIKTKKNVEELLKWYREVLQLETSEYGLNFLCPNELTLITFNNEQDEVTLNFTVENLKAFMKELKEKEVVVHKEIQEYDYGSFAQILDPFGFIIELFEPNKENYIDRVKKEIEEYKKV